jgi:choice-of-anchor B domain-containing protein
MIQRNKGFRMAGGLFIAMCLLVALVWAGQSTLSAQEEQPAGEVPLNPIMQAMLDNPPDIQDLEAMAFTPCVGGTAGGYACENVDLLSFTPIGTVGGGTGADAWGWIDSQTGNEYAIMNRTNGTGFFDITDPENPIYLGNLPTSTGVASWRDAKVYQDHVYIVSDGNGAHGMQVFDLTNLRNVVSPPVTFTETNHYSTLGSAHNIVINEDSGYAYAVGVSSGTQTCSGGLHVIDLSTPASPVFVDCYTASGYTHDAQCVNYIGPDPDHQGDEICFNFNGNSGFYVVDVTNKAAMVELSFTSYTQQDYTHQGWVTDDHRYVIMDDELDEMSFGINTRTRIFDVSNLDAPPVLIGFFDGPVASTDHNLYLHNGYAFEANYSSGLRILDTSDVANGNLSQAGYFDTYTPNNSPNFSGAWTAYPYFDSGNVIINSRGEGLFVVRPKAEFEITKGQPVGTLDVGETITYTITVTNTGIGLASNVVVSDTMNGGSAVVVSGAASLLPGESATYTFTYVISPGDCTTGLSNMASVSSDYTAAEALAAPVVTPLGCVPSYNGYLPFVSAE